jgi:hypothetical protein
VSNDLTVTGGSTVTANAGNAEFESLGIFVSNDLTVTGGSTVTANAGNAGNISLGLEINTNLDISGGSTLTVASGTAPTSRAMYWDWNVPSGVNYRVSTNTSGTPITDEGTGPFEITSAHKWVELKR